MMAKIILGETKRGRPKKGQKMHNLKGPKRRRELVSFVVGNYFTHNISNVTSMQIVRSNSSGRFKINITYQYNLPLCNKG
jgi:hypothetical protein